MVTTSETHTKKRQNVTIVLIKKYERFANIGRGVVFHLPLKRKYDIRIRITTILTQETTR